MELKNVSKRYGTVQANNDIDLAVYAGSIHAVLGENGAGKSTLMKMIYGLEKPDTGTIYWKGKQAQLGKPSDAQALGIGMVFQHFSLFEALSVTEKRLTFSAWTTSRISRKNYFIWQPVWAAR